MVQSGNFSVVTPSIPTVVNSPVPVISVENDGSSVKKVDIGTEGLIEYEVVSYCTVALPNVEYKVEVILNRSVVDFSELGIVAIEDVSYSVVKVVKLVISTVSVKLDTGRLVYSVDMDDVSDGIIVHVVSTVDDETYEVCVVL